MVRHGVFTRLGGESQPPFASLNVGHTVGDDNRIADANQDRIYAALGVAPEQVVTAHQVHGQRVHRATLADGGQVIPSTDALISDAPGLTLLLRFADCLPILLVDPVHRAVGLAHAGWRGAMQNVAGQTVAAMCEAFGSSPGDLLAGLGPTIQRCCYQVGEEVIAAARAAFPPEAAVLVKQPDQSCHFDQMAASAWQLAQAGVTKIEAAPFCTSCQVAEFYSHRRERGRTGRFAVLLGLR